jgi:hypothetical protein
MAAQIPAALCTCSFFILYLLDYMNERDVLHGAVICSSSSFWSHVESKASSGISKARCLCVMQQRQRADACPAFVYSTSASLHHLIMITANGSPEAVYLELSMIQPAGVTSYIANPTSKDEYHGA